MTFKERLYNIIIEHNTKGGKYFDLFIQVLIILSLFTFSLETLPNISDRLRNFLDYFETFAIVVFTLEYFLRVYLTRPTSSYLFSFYGIIDFLAIYLFIINYSIILHQTKNNTNGFVSSSRLFSVRRFIVRRA